MSSAGKWHKGYWVKTARNPNLYKKKGAERDKAKADWKGTYVPPVIIRKPTSTSDDFYQTKEWLDLRYRVLRKYGRICMLCGAVPPIQMHVDHIKPRLKYPLLALDPKNLQVLCRECNLGKSYKHEDDFRPDTTKSEKNNHY